MKWELSNMPIEQFTEEITKKMMGISIGEQDFGYVFPQGDVPRSIKIYNLLKACGGKPIECALE